MHSSGAVWLGEWVAQIQNSGEIKAASLACIAEATLGNFEGDYAGRISY